MPVRIAGLKISKKLKFPKKLLIVNKRYEYCADLLHFLEVTFDQKRISANHNLNPNSNPNPKAQ